FVGATLQPGKKTANTVPDAISPATFTIGDPFLLFRCQVFPGSIQRDFAFAGVFFQIILTFTITGALENFDSAFAQCFIVVRNDQVKIHINDTTKTATGFAGTNR